MLADAGPVILDGLARANSSVSMISNGSPARGWEVALFNLCNELQEAGGQLIVAAGSAPRECDLELADLASRLSRLPVFQVRLSTSSSVSRRCSCVRGTAAWSCRTILPLPVKAQPARHGQPLRAARQAGPRSAACATSPDDSVRPRCPAAIERLVARRRAMSATRLPSACASCFSSSDNASGLRFHVTWVGP